MNDIDKEPPPIGPVASRRGGFDGTEVEDVFGPAACLILKFHFVSRETTVSTTHVNSEK